ncbi:hypothetical protein BD310DRAFT_246449 [Dichomitus squalens]|uniref:Uncharacterized protein n=1 Tax=Dichomitus squalens TaxID=114155 RepID=A0A4Q9PGK4_9APHY|nr:hypothetical protein BD310DRAFT_246449 [Dichomitus squalens]
MLLRLHKTMSSSGMYISSAHHGIDLVLVYILGHAQYLHRPSSLLPDLWTPSVRTATSPLSAALLMPTSLRALALSSCDAGGTASSLFRISAAAVLAVLPYSPDKDHGRMPRKWSW